MSHAIVIGDTINAQPEGLPRRPGGAAILALHSPEKSPESFIQIQDGPRKLGAGQRKARAEGCYPQPPMDLSLGTFLGTDCLS